MTREELISEISMRSDVSLEDVEDVLEEEDIILDEMEKKRKKKKAICFFSTTLVFLAGAIATLFVLDRKDKIDAERIMNEYQDIVSRRLNDLQAKVNQLLND